MKRKNILETPLKDLTIGELIPQLGKFYFWLLGIGLLLHYLLVWGLK